MLHPPPPTVYVVLANRMNYLPRDRPFQTRVSVVWVRQLNYSKRAREEFHGVDG